MSDNKSTQKESFALIEDVSGKEIENGKIRETVVDFMRNNFSDNEDFRFRAKKTYRQNASGKVITGLRYIQLELIKRLQSVDEVNEKVMFELVSQIVDKMGKIEGVKISKGFKELVKKRCGNISVGNNNSQTRDLKPEEMIRPSVKQNKRRPAEIKNETETEKETTLEELREKIGKEGTVFVFSDGNIVVTERYIVKNGNGQTKIAYYDKTGNRVVVGLDKFEKIIEKADEKKDDYKKEAARVASKVRITYGNCSKFLDKNKSNIGEKEYLSYKKSLNEIYKSLGKLREVNKKNGNRLLQNGIEDFVELSDVLREIRKIRTEADEIVLKKERIKRKKDFERKYGVDESYVLMETNENGHKAPTSSFTLVGYLLGRVKKDDRVEIEWHNEMGKKEKISLKRFKSLLQEGYKKESDLLKSNQVEVKDYDDEKEKRRDLPERDLNKKEERKKSAEKNISDGGDERENEREIEQAKQKANQYRDEYFRKMGWGTDKDKDIEGDQNLAGDLEMTDKFERDDESGENFIDKRLEMKLQAILEENPGIEKEIIRRTFDPESRDNSYDRASIKDKILMLLGEKSNRSRRKYLEKDYTMDRKMGGLKRFFGKTFHFDNFEKELEEYKKEYEKWRNEYKEAILELEGVGDREEAEILARDFQVSERLRWRNDQIEIAMENNPLYENFKKFLLGAVDRYRKMRRWPSDKISEFFGFKGLSKGIGIVSGMLLTGKMLQEAGLIANPAYRVFSVAVTSVGYKQMAESLAEKRRIKKDEKEIKKAVNKFGANFEIGRNINEFDEWLTEKNKRLDQDIQNEKYWRNWRTIMAGGTAIATFFGGELLSEKLQKYFAGTHHQTGQNHFDKNQTPVGEHQGVEHQTVKKELSSHETSDNVIDKTSVTSKVATNNAGTQHLRQDGSAQGDIEEPFPLGYDNNEIGRHNVVGGHSVSATHHIENSHQGNSTPDKPVKIPSNNENAGSETKIAPKKNVTVGKHNVGARTEEIINPNLAQERNVTGSEMQLAYGMGFTPREYLRIRDLHLSQISDSHLRRLYQEFGVSQGINPKNMTVGEFLRKLDVRNVVKDMKLKEMSGSDYIKYFAEVINNKAVEIKRMLVSGNLPKWKELSGHLAIGERDEKFRQFYRTVSKQFSFYARPNESVNGWITRLTKFAYERGILNDVEKDLQNIVGRKF